MISFTDIASQAQQSQKYKLANMLLEYEPNITKKVPVLLQMKEYAKALKESLDIHNSNLLNMVIIQKANRDFDWTQKSKEQLYEMMSSN